MNLRLIAIVSLLTSSLFAAGPIPVHAQSTSANSTLTPASIIAFTNADRKAAGTSAVQENAALTLAAQQKADDMLAQQYFSHVSPGGRAPWQWFRSNGYSYIYAAENLAMNFSDPLKVETAWMNSPTHRANVLNGNYKEIGIGVARGTYLGKPVIFIVEFFGTQKTAVKTNSLAKK